MKHKSNLLSGILAGALGGLAGAWAMNQFQSLLSKASSTEQEQQEQQQQPQQQQPPVAQQQQDSQEDQDTTVKTATIISRNVLGHELTKEEKKAAGPAVHYGFGALVGMVYGTLAELAPLITTGNGLVYGTVVWAVADEGVLAAVGLTKPPTEYPLSSHASALGAHLVYGLTLETARRLTRTIP